jgi:hypothetical protein
MEWSDERREGRESGQPSGFPSLHREDATARSAKTRSGSVSGRRVYQVLCRALSAVKAWGYFSISSTG